MNFQPTRPFHTSVFDIQRRVVANKTLEGWQTVPHAAVMVEADITGLMDLAARLKTDPAFAGVRITINSLLLKLIADGLQAAPEMNAHINYSRASAVGVLTLFEEINIAIPYRSRDGRMFTPVVRDVGGMGLIGVCAAMEDLKRRAANTDLDMLLREAGVGDSVRRLCRGDLRILWRLLWNFFGPARLPKIPQEARKHWAATAARDKITPENLHSATVVVSNTGSVLPGSGVVLEVLEIIPPQTVAIGIGAMARKQVVVSENGVETTAIRSMVPITVCFDHRAMDLEHIRPFIATILDYCRTPEKLLEQ